MVEFSESLPSASGERFIGTFLFTDIEGSTRLWENDSIQMQAALAVHDSLVQEAVNVHDGKIFKSIGDAFCVFFLTPFNAVQAALDIQRRLATYSWGAMPVIRVRAAVYTGEASARGGDFFGPALNRVARIMAVGHGGQTLISGSVQKLLPPLPLGVKTVPLGPHRLRDLQQPEELFELVSEDLPVNFPPLKSLSLTSETLPKAVSTFIGRESEIQRVESLLTRCRLLSLVGAGGTGKTRLALEVAYRQAIHFPDGTWFADLSQLTDGELIPQTSAQAMGISPQPDQTVLDAITQGLRHRRSLLILDNCEHVIDQAAQFAQELLKSSANLIILATSRQSLGLAGETTWRVPSLSLPPVDGCDPDSILAFDATRMFVERALQVRPDLAMNDQSSALICRICQELDGIPLAIELAAARLRSIPLDKLSDRLDQRFRLLAQSVRGVVPRHQTLRAMIDWSYDLLDSDERELLTRVSVFSGGFTLEAAEAVCSGGSVEPYDVLDLCAALVDKSLIASDDSTGRYRLLETVRAYVRELGNSDVSNATWQERHLDYFLALTASAEPHLIGAASRTWIETLEIELKNWRTAFSWALETGFDSKAAQLAIPLTRFFQQRGYLEEGQAVYTRLLDHRSELGELDLARTLRSASAIARTRGHLESAIGLCREALVLFEKVGDDSGAASAMTTLGIALVNTGQVEEGKRFHERSLELVRRQGSIPMVAMGLNNLGTVSYQLRDYSEAIAYYEEALALNRQFGNATWMAYNLGNLAEAYNAVGDASRALKFGVESFEILVANQDRPVLSQLLLSLAVSLCRIGKDIFAARLYGFQRQLLEELQMSIPPNEVAEYEKGLASCRSSLGEGRFLIEFESGRRLALDDIRQLLRI